MGGWCALRRAALVAMVIGTGGCCSAGRAQEPAGGADGDGAGEVAAADGLVERVRAMLSGYEHVPGAAEWERVGPADEVAAALMALATEPGAKTVMALRATSSLAFFPRPEVDRFLVSRVADPRLAASARGKAAMALAVAFRDARADEVVALLAESDVALREDAARALGSMWSPAVERFVVARAAVEPVPHVKEALANAGRKIAEGRREAEARGALPETVRDRAMPRDPGPVR